MPSVNDIYSGILKPGPQGGIFEPGPPVMLPPQGMGSNQALAQALMNPVGPGPDAGALDGMLNDPIYGGGAAPYAGMPVVPHANGTIIANKDQTRLPTSPPGNLFAYDGGGIKSPAQTAIDIVVNGGSGLLGSGLGIVGGQTHRMFPTDARGMPIDSDIPTNSPRYRAPVGLAALGGGGGQPNGGGLAALPSIRIASGRTVPIGSTGSAQGGRYSYAVQPNGSVVNTTTGHVTATPTGPVGVAAVANAPAPQPTLNQVVYGQSHDFGPGYRPF